MKRSIGLSLLLLAVAAPTLAAPNSCEEVTARIQQKILSNGVPESGFSLTIVANDEVDTSGATRVVGHCANDSYKIIYTRHRDTQ